jgi:hypothetical protein
MRYDANHIFISARDTSRVQPSGMGGAGQKIGFPELILCAATLSRPLIVTGGGLFWLKGFYRFIISA